MSWVGVPPTTNGEKHWAIWDLGFLLKTHTDDGVQAAWQGPFFFSEITRPWNLGTCFGDFELNIN